MAKKRKVVKKSATKASKIFYRPETYGIKYNSLTFLLFLVFVLVVSIILIGRVIGINFY